jgi:hypothetical protein
MDFFDIIVNMFTDADELMNLCDVVGYTWFPKCAVSTISRNEHTIKRLLCEGRTGQYTAGESFDDKNNSNEEKLE